MADPHYGLEHFGLHTDNIEATMAELEERATEILLPMTQVASGNKIAYVKGPHRAGPAVSLANFRAKRSVP